jgi:hypothetical protein
MALELRPKVNAIAAEAGVYLLPPPPAAESCPRSGLQEIATGFSRWMGPTIH